jgi:orotate phosphoribosyltransferase
MKLSYTFVDANIIAKDMLEIGAVQFNPESPFTFTSGRISPIYVDVRMMIGMPAIRSKLYAISSNFIMSKIGSRNFNIVAGGETAGIPFATMIADRLHKQLCYVRKSPKGFGKGNQIEGLTEQQKKTRGTILLVEDLCSDGGSKKVFVDALRKAGHLVNDAFVIFSYGVFGAEETMAEYGVKLHSLVNANQLLDVAEDLNYLPQNIISQIRNYLLNSKNQDDNNVKSENP